MNEIIVKGWVIIMIGLSVFSGPVSFNNFSQAPKCYILTSAVALGSEMGAFVNGDTVAPILCSYNRGPIRTGSGKYRFHMTTTLL
jgi:hypothetical protein